MGWTKIARALLAGSCGVNHRVALLKTWKVVANESPMVTHVIQITDCDSQAQATD
jgi:hypothetical protein